jgi:hypothetical protein
MAAMAAPALAADPTPEPVPALYGATPAAQTCPSDPAAPAPTDCVMEAVPTEEVVPIDACTPDANGVTPEMCTTLVAPAPVDPGACDPETVAAVEAGTVGAVVTACLLPDGSLLPVNVMTLNDGQGDYERWMADFKASLAPCPEGADPNDLDLATCLLPDGSIAGPVPMFAAADGAVMDKGLEESSEGSEAPLALLAAVAAAAAVALLIARRRAAK